MKPCPQTPPAPAPRREFVRTGLRYAGLSALGLMSWRVASNSHCAKADPCGDCAQFSGCDLPKARRQKAQPEPRDA